MEQTNLSICRLVQNWIPQAIRDKLDLEGEILAKIAYFLGLIRPSPLQADDFGKMLPFAA